MYRTLTIVDGVLLRALNAIVMFTNVAIMALILIGIVSRFLGLNLVGMLELATISAIWLYMAGAIVAARNNEHLVVDFLTQRVSSKWRGVHKIATSLLILLISIFFISLAQDMLEFASRRPQTTPALSLPLLFPQSAIVLAAICTAAYALRDVVCAITDLKKPSDEKAD